MFGVPAEKLAMYHVAKPEKKKWLWSILLSAAISAFVCGVTEPFGFAFMFLAPRSVPDLRSAVRYLRICYHAGGLRAGFSSRQEPQTYCSPRPCSRAWMIFIPLGIAAAIIFYGIPLRYREVQPELHRADEDGPDAEQVMGSGPQQLYRCGSGCRA